jgi:hypothetical protein
VAVQDGYRELTEDGARYVGGVDGAQRRTDREQARTEADGTLDF